MVPRVSVVMPVYNVASHVEATITSVLTQTFTNFELLIFDDCSTDTTAAVVQAMHDPRIRFFQNSHNLGRAGADNAALAHVRGEFIAKMDGDDLCHPERLARQVACFDSQPDVNVVGAWMQNFGASTYLNRYPTTPAAAQVLTLFTLPTGNPSVMLRSQLFWEQGMTYDGSLRQTEDYDFFARYVRELRVATLPEALIQYRVPPDAVKTAILTERATVADEVRIRLLRDWGLACTERELWVHNTIAMLGRPLGDITLAEVEAWLLKLAAFNDRQPLFEPVALQRGLGERWFEICYTHPQRRLRGAKQFGRSPLAAHFPVSGSQQLKLWLQAVRRF